MANAILDGTDAVMLSGETSVGEHPFEAVRVMGRIAEDVEQSNLLKPRDLSTIEALSGPSHTVARCATMAVQESDRPLVVFTWSGRSAVLASKARMAAPIFALTPDERVCDALALVLGNHGRSDARLREHRRDDPQPVSRCSSIRATSSLGQESLCWPATRPCAEPPTS